MTKNARRKVLGACYKFLLPIARVLLSHGISYKEFDEACRQAFVQTASTEFGVRGRETNISRISVMTGIPRKQVQEIRKSRKFEGIEPEKAFSPLTDLLHLWATADEYQDRAGRALRLPMLRESGKSFHELVRTCMGDITPGAVKAELLRLGVITVSSDGKLILKRRTLIPDDIDTRLEVAMVFGLRGLADTIAHNNNPKIDASDRLFQRFVESRPLSEAKLRQIRSKVHDRLIEITEELDALLNAAPESDADPADRRVGVGIYYSE